MGRYGRKLCLALFQTHYRTGSRSASRAALKRKREASVSQSRSRARSSSRTPRDKSGVRDDTVSLTQGGSILLLLVPQQPLGYRATLDLHHVHQLFCLSVRQAHFCSKHISNTLTGIATLYTDRDDSNSTILG